MFDQHLYRFPTYAAPQNATRTHKENLLQDLKGKLSKGMIKGVTSFHITLPLSTHNHKLIGFARRISPLL